MGKNLQTDSIAIMHLKRAIAEGKHWHIALLEAINLWTVPEEEYEGKHYTYLIGGEAFDWLLLARRLCNSVDVLIPGEEKTALFHYGQQAMAISKEEFRRLIGYSKYSAHLNYFYGIIVERALIHAVRDEIQKERQMYPCCQDRREFEDHYRRIYNHTRSSLLEKFYNATCHRANSTDNDPDDSPEFIYWIFKYRLTNSDKARIASDTKKGLNFLKAQQRLKIIS